MIKLTTIFVLLCKFYIVATFSNDIKKMCWNKNKPVIFNFEINNNIVKVEFPKELFIQGPSNNIAFFKENSME